MTTKRVKTTKLQDKDYAYVADRLKEFREDCPNGLIETRPDIRDDGQVMFTARVVKDKSKPESAEASGHSLGKNTGVKAFEKLETIAVGRALALLGYLASGEIASSEEMEEFNAYKEEQRSSAITLAIESIEDAKTMNELKEVFVSLGNIMGESKVIEAKDKRKAELAQPKKTVTKKVQPELAK